MAYRIHLISQNAASAAVLAAVLARLHHLVTVVAPTQVVAQDADLFLLDGSENASGLLAALADAPGWDGAAHVPRLIALNDRALMGAAVLAQFDIDGCVLLPVHEQILALHIDTLMKGATQLHRLRTVWPAGMPPPTVPMAPAQILILDDDGYTAQRCAGAVTAVDALAETVSWFSWQAQRNDRTPDLILACPPAGTMGQVALRALSAHQGEHWPNASLVLVANQNLGQAGLRRAKAAGFSRFLEKPFSAQHLQFVVGRTLTLQRTIGAYRTAIASLSETASRDEVTGLRPRDFAERSLRHSPDLVVALLDLDNLKVINDRIGHLAGDEALRQVGSHLQVQFGTQAMMARWGGDEFLIASEGELGPSEIAEKLGHVQRALNSVDLDPSGRRKLRPVFSFGLAQGHEAPSVTALIALADQRLYVQKRTKKEGQEPSKS